MIQHCVFIRFRSDVGRQERDAIYAALRALEARIEGMTGIAISSNASPEGLDKGFSEGFIVSFRDAAARDAYLVDTEHEKVGAAIVAAAEGGLDGILVFDLEA